MSDLRNSWAIITPEQFADELLRSRHRSPEQRLCIAHLTDAFADAINTKSIYRARKQQAIDWIAGKMRGRMSFELCCEGLELDVQWLRERMLRRMHDDDILKLFKRTRRATEVAEINPFKRARRVISSGEITNPKGAS